MNLHVTFNMNGTITTSDYPNATGAFTINLNTGFLTLFTVMREGKTVAQFQAGVVVGWDNSNPAA